jgi:signal transduction histidine kinase
MSADQLIQLLSWAIFMLVFIIVAVRAARAPRLAAIEIALFFSAPALIIVLAVLAAVGSIEPGPTFTALTTALLLSIGYLLLRVVDKFASVPAWLLRGSELGLALLAISAFALPTQRPGWLSLVMAAYLIGLLIYSAVAFVAEARQSRGVTRRRMQAAAAGSILLVTLFLLSTLGLVLPELGTSWRMLMDTCGLAAAIAYYLGFAPPRWLRRAWQGPELRAFLSRAANLSRLPDQAAILREIEHGFATALGAPSARIGLWSDDIGAIQFPLGDVAYRLRPSDDVPAAQAFQLQRVIFTDNLPRDQPAYREMSLAYRMISVLAAPITISGQRIGVLVAYGPNMLIFAEDDLELAQVLADQAATILEIRSLIDEAARSQAREEAARLKEDFLSAAAHDLKTPLTALIARAQMMERTAVRQPGQPADLGGLRMIVSEGQRLRRLVLELLDATRVEQGKLVSMLERVELVALAEEICGRQQSALHSCTVESAEPVEGMFDHIRIAQLFENIVENAIQYSPRGGAVRIKIWRSAGQACVEVSDEGVGIRGDDLPHVFERFYRGSNADDRHFAGMGLGLFICRGIVEQHGGRIWASSEPGQGSTFHIELPLLPVAEQIYA